MFIPKVFRQIIVCLFIGCILVNTGFSWNGYSHIVITTAAGYPELAPYSNLPDNWSSKEFKSIDKIITDYFAWSHRLRVNSAQGVPDKGNEDPAEDMIILMRKWVRLYGEKATDTARLNGRNTALGWRAHLAADNVVHFDYFTGGEMGWVRHLYLESYADLLIYVEDMCRGAKVVKLTDIERIFSVEIDSKTGKVAKGNGNLQKSITLQDIPWTGDLPLIALAQKVYLKNQQSTSIKKLGYRQIEIQSLATIANEMAIEHQKCVKAMNDDFTYENYLYACSDIGQIILNDIMQPTDVIFVKHPLGYKRDGEIFIHQSNGAMNENATAVIVDIDYNTGRIILDEPIKNFSSGSYVTGFRGILLKYHAEPYQIYFDRAVEAVRSRIAELKAKLND